jgi:hypothetical protein
MRRLWAWFLRRFHHPDWTLAPITEPPKRTYCAMAGHLWGGWRRDGEFFSRRCRRRRCPAKQVATDKLLVDNNAFYKGGKIWGFK